MASHPSTVVPGIYFFVGVRRDIFVGWLCFSFFLGGKRGFLEKSILLIFVCHRFLKVEILCFVQAAPEPQYVGMKWALTISVWQLSAVHVLFSSSWNFGQLFGLSRTNCSMSVLYLSVLLLLLLPTRFDF